MKRWLTNVGLWLLAVGALTPSQGARPYVEVARFRGDALAAVSLTFDDAFPSQIEKAIPLFDEQGLHATFFVHTDNVKATWASTWEAWKAASATGHEVGSHTKTHPNLTHIQSARQLRSEIEGSAAMIEQRVGIRPISFAYPFSAVNADVRRQVLDVYLLDRSDCRMWGGQGFGADTGIGHIEQAVEKRAWFYCMMHGVDEVSFRPITTKALGGIVKYLGEHRDTIWTETYGFIGRYVKERMLANVKFREEKADSFEVRLVLPDLEALSEALIVPLTLKISLDEHDGARSKAYRHGEAIATTISRNGDYLLVDLVPNGEWVKVVWGD